MINDTIKGHVQTFACLRLLLKDFFTQKITGGTRQKLILG